MKTTLELDDTLIDALLARHPEYTAVEAIEHAIRAYFAADLESSGLRSGPITIVRVR